MVKKTWSLFHLCGHFLGLHLWAEVGEGGGHFNADFFLTFSQIHWHWLTIALKLNLNRHVKTWATVYAVVRQI